MVKLDQFAVQTTSSLQELVDTKIIEQSNRISAVTEVFKDALMLSNKTYFLEQVTKHKLEKKAVKKELNITIEKYKLMESNYKQV
jgi:hypothetical protein